ncbi:hypothetical protein BDV28DRAFT_142983 [Aspergillus coremiiformis]|uniref:Uncharacterized protein n=1 Tax=Aspergillus coremiiformis TaxID=138285 RepID=A0A5N6YTE9_9EURO|nr:hypothetical protein BDV28DRAFT_142983 [Aspergillus coremiiformis]
MMVPRAFLFSSVPPLHHGGKSQFSKSEMDFVAVPDVSSLELHKESSHTSPVIIPPKRGSRVTPFQREPVSKGFKTRTAHRSTAAAAYGDRPVPTSIASILKATAIPVPRRKRTTREPRRIPQGNHVQDFSKLLMEGVRSKEDSLMEGTGNTMLDILLSPPEDNDRFASGSDYDSETPSLSAHSLSVESMASLDADLESPFSSPMPSTPCSQRSPCERRYLRLSQYESCVSDHPLLDDELSDSEREPLQQPTLLDNTPTKSSSRSFPRLGSTFKSNLTASLRAIKSAAQTVSTFATPSVQPDDFLTRSLFTITPKMTDDRRPPPMKEPPSPALRRYFNPVTFSPAEIYAYQDHPHECLDTRNCPVSVQMQTYHRSGKRGYRKSGFHLSGSEGHGRHSSSFDPEVPPMSRQREPRENSDFLRMVVLEMNMRRSGKLRDDIPPRARISLPPRKGHQSRHSPYNYYEDEDEEERTIPSRWVGISADHM